nr:branched-chain amino acid ABC transporter permease [Clostridia bacterium]
MKTKKFNFRVIDIALLVVLFALVFVADMTLPTYDIKFKVLQKGAVFALVAVSMNLLNGFTGLFSLGQAGFMLLGAYTYAIFTIPNDARLSVYKYYTTVNAAGEEVGGLVQFVLPVGVAIILAGAVAAVFAYFIGLPVLRLKSDYLAIASLGFAEILRAICQWKGLGALTNGSNQLRSYPYFNKIMPYFLISGACIAVIALLIKSTYGRAFKAIRDDEVAAEAMGINLAKHKMLSFVISSFFAGIGGALFAMYQNTIQAKPFTTTLTYEILLIVVIGGIGSLSGSVIASFLYIACSEWWLRFLDTPDVIPGLTRNGFRLVVFSAVIMIIVLFFRRGIMGDKEFSTERLVNGVKSFNKSVKEKREKKAKEEA